MSRLITIPFFKGTNFLPAVFLLLIYVCGTGCSEKDNNILAVEPSDTDSEADFSLPWLGVWKGTADLYEETYYTEHIFNTQKNEHCIIKISKNSSDQIFFTMSEPILFQAIITVDADTTFKHTQRSGEYKLDAFVVRTNDGLTGIAEKYKLITDVSHFVEAERVFFSCVLEGR